MFTNPISGKFVCFFTITNFAKRKSFRYFALMITLDILICTIDSGIENVADVLMPPCDGIHYVVSMQYTDKNFLRLVPAKLKERHDVTLTFIEGRGLSRNRNNAIEHATGDVMVIADDDNRYTKALIENILEGYEAHPNADIIHFQALNMDGMPLHPYPADYVSSVEMTFRKEVSTRFNEHFGLGSEKLCSGEEQVWLRDARNDGYNIVYVPKPIVRTNAVTTGNSFVGNKKMQRSKGATFCYVYGRSNAIWRSIKESGWWFVHRKANPIVIFLNMMEGVNYLSSLKRRE